MVIMSRAGYRRGSRCGVGFWFQVSERETKIHTLRPGRSGRPDRPGRPGRPVLQRPRAGRGILRKSTFNAELHAAE